ncbi:Uncharacterized protein FKW44_016647, partial [Caligus rogercresseyi]
MSEQHNNRNKIAGLLFAGITPTEIAFTLNVSRPTIYDVKCQERPRGQQDLERMPGSDWKPILNCKDVKTAVEAEPTKSMAAHAKDMGV